MDTYEKMFKSVEEMSEISGIGTRTIRKLIRNQEIDFLLVGKRHLLTEQAFWDWYERAKTPANTSRTR